MFELRFFEIYRSLEYVNLLWEGILISTGLTISAGIAGFLLAFLLVSCASYQPIADLKASKNANDFQEDRQHCKLLIKEEFNAFYSAWYDRELLSRCLNGRGHNVLNTYTIGN